MRNLFMILMATLLVQCTGTTQPGPGEYIYWVNSLEVPCEATGPALCLQVQKAEIPDPTRWESFYASISGFEFEAGYRYKLIVKEMELDAESVPADGSSMAYTLVKMLEKIKDKRLLLNNRWALEILNGNTLVPGSISEESQPPQLEIQVSEMNYNGTDGCNHIFGGIAELNESNLRFGIGAGTRMMCQNMEIPDEFNRTLPEVNNYQVLGVKLHLFDKDGHELMVFQKMD